MTTPTLPDRLRALADFIDAHNLPEPYLTIQSADYGTANFDTHEELCEWAEVLGTEIRTARYERPDRTYDYYSIDPLPVAGQRLFFAYAENIIEVPA